MDYDISATMHAPCVWWHMGHVAVHSQDNELSEPARHTAIFNLTVSWYTSECCNYSPLFCMSFVFVKCIFLTAWQFVVDNMVAAYEGYRVSDTAFPDRCNVLLTIGRNSASFFCLKRSKKHPFRCNFTVGLFLIFHGCLMSRYSMFDLLMLFTRYLVFKFDVEIMTKNHHKSYRRQDYC